jgi:hypothetical protein
MLKPTLFAILLTPSLALAATPKTKAGVLEHLRAAANRPAVSEHPGGINAEWFDRGALTKARDYRFDAQDQLVEEQTRWSRSKPGRDYDSRTLTYDAQGVHEVRQRSLGEFVFQTVYDNRGAKDAPVRFTITGSPQMKDALDRIMPVVESGRAAIFQWSFGLEYLVKPHESRQSVVERLWNFQGTRPAAAH